MSGKLYGVGMGPGDPELITVKALKLIKETSVLAVPKSKDGDATAMKIACDVLKESEEEDGYEEWMANKTWLFLDLPMSWDQELLNQRRNESAWKIIEKLEQGLDVAFLTLGDPTIYSTFGYIRDIVMQEGWEVETVPGVTSFCAVAARLNVSLAQGEQPLHIIPASYYGAKEDLSWKGPKVLMKSGSLITKVKTDLKNAGLLESSKMVSRCGMEGEEVFESMEKVTDGANYFSVILVPNNTTEELDE